MINHLPMRHRHIRIGIAQFLSRQPSSARVAEAAFTLALVGDFFQAFAFSGREAEVDFYGYGVDPEGELGMVSLRNVKDDWRGGESTQPAAPDPTPKLAEICMGSALLMSASTITICSGLVPS